ncbi:hypothetical protein D9611_013051 [Ephemerocybe angulata]|uniref:Uncharacterized protein n=1 Tax=Ephemerocybe angulata TaxID=980116 RepID=A0A8H5AUJ7_9AGAR|nr:hypothetical protein D9611_013051 [Tulosesus angulatus]
MEPGLDVVSVGRVYHEGGVLEFPRAARYRFFVDMMLTVFSTLLRRFGLLKTDDALERRPTDISNDDPTPSPSPIHTDHRPPLNSRLPITTVEAMAKSRPAPSWAGASRCPFSSLVLLITLPSFALGREFSLVWAAMTPDKFGLSVVLALRSWDAS